MKVFRQVFSECGTHRRQNMVKLILFCMCVFLTSGIDAGSRFPFTNVGELLIKFTLFLLFSTIVMVVNSEIVMLCDKNQQQSVADPTWKKSYSFSCSYRKKCTNNSLESSLRVSTPSGESWIH